MNRKRQNKRRWTTGICILLCMVLGQLSVLQAASYSFKKIKDLSSYTFDDTKVVYTDEISTYKKMDAFCFLEDGETWVVIKENDAGQNILLDSLGNTRIYEPGVLGHANDMTYYAGNLIVTARSDSAVYGMYNGKKYPMIGLSAQTYEPVAGYSYNSKLTKKLGKYYVAGITYVPGVYYKKTGTSKKYPVFVMRVGQSLVKTYLNNKTFGFISMCKYTTPDLECGGLVKQGITYNKFDKKLYLGFGVHDVGKTSCGNMAWICRVKYSKVGTKTVALSSYIKSRRSSYSTFEVECIDFSSTGELYFNINGVKTFTFEIPAPEIPVEEPTTSPDVSVSPEPSASPDASALPESIAFQKEAESEISDFEEPSASPEPTETDAPPKESESPSPDMIIKEVKVQADGIFSVSKN